MKASERALPPGLERHLRRLDREYRRRLLLRGLLRLGGLSLLLACVAWGAWERVPQGYGAGAVLLLLAGWCGGLWAWAVRPLRVRPDRRRLALLLDERLPQLENLALSSLDFSRADFTPDSDWLIGELLSGADAEFKATASTAARVSPSNPIASPLRTTLMMPGRMSRSASST